MKTKFGTKLKQLAFAVFRAISVVVFAASALPLLWLVKPFWRIRVRELQESRIGHLAANTDLFLRRIQLDGAPKRTTQFVLAWKSATPTLLRLIKRRLTIWEINAKDLYNFSLGRQLADLETYNRLGIKWRENSADDIFGLAMDLMDRLEGRATRTRCSSDVRMIYCRR